MAPSIKFFAGLNQIQDLQGSGLGFYGAGGFGATVPVGAWQGRTYITNAAGTTNGPEGNNVQYLNAASGVLGQVGSGLLLTQIPNYQATLNLRFNNDTAVQVQNAQIRIYDGVSINNPPSGVQQAVAEIIHPNPTQSNIGSGSAAWVFPVGSGLILNLSQSPGTSGTQASSSSTYKDSQHDFFIALSGSPNSIGMKTYGMYAYLEYL